MKCFVFPDTVKYYNRIVDRVSNQCQNCSDERIVYGESEDRIECNYYQNVVYNTCNSRKSVFPGFKSENNIDKHSNGCNDNRLKSVHLEFITYGRSELFRCKDIILGNSISLL